MSLDADAIVDRRRMRRKLTFWRVAAVLVALIAIGAVALLLGIKLVKNGAIAIFCGRKTTAANLCDRAVDIFDRQVPLTAPAVHSDPQETKRLHYLHAQNLGPDAAAIVGIAIRHDLPSGMSRFDRTPYIVAATAAPQITGLSCGRAHSYFSATTGPVPTSPACTSLIREL